VWWADFGQLPDSHQDDLTPPSSTGQREKIREKSSGVEIKTWRSLTNYCHMQNSPYLEQINLIYCPLK